MTTDNDAPKDAHELKELTKVVRSIDLETDAPNETCMTDANERMVHYHPDFMPAHLKAEWLSEMKRYPPPSAAEVAATEKELQKHASEEWPIEQRAMVGDEHSPENDIEVAP